MKPEIEQKCAELTDAFEAFRRAATNSNPQRRHEGGACGRWSPKEIIDHLAGWDRALQSFIANPDAFVPPESVDLFNDRSVAEQQNLSWDQSLSLLNAGFERLSASAKTVNPEMKIYPRVIIWLQRRTADYDLHTTQLQGWQ